jgi:putative flippase GtrA
MLSRIVRYCSVGFLITATYFAATVVAFEWTQAMSIVCSLIGFFIALPIAYAGHRYISFRSTGRHVVELPRFIVATSTMFVVSSVSIVVFVDLLHTSYLVPLTITSLLVPLVNFLVLQMWVFRGEHRPGVARP